MIKGAKVCGVLSWYIAAKSLARTIVGLNRSLGVSFQCLATRLGWLVPAYLDCNSGAAPKLSVGAIRDRIAEGNICG
jgi:hypothetical protein